MLAGHDWAVKDVREAVTEFVVKCPQRLYGVQPYFEEDKKSELSEKENQVSDWWFIK